MDLTNLIKETQIRKVLAGSSVAGTVLAATACVEMDNYNGVCFMAAGMWTSGAGHLFKLQKCATSTGGSAEDLTGASAEILNGFQAAVINLAKPRNGHRYIRGVYIKAAVASAYGDVFAIQYNGRKRGDNINTSSDADSGIEFVSVISPST